MLLSETARKGGGDIPARAGDSDAGRQVVAADRKASRKAHDGDKEAMIARVCNVYRPEFLQAAKSMLSSLPRFAAAKKPRFAVAKTPLQPMINERWTGTRRTKHVAKWRALGHKGVATERVRAWKATRRLLKELLQL